MPAMREHHEHAELRLPMPMRKSDNMDPKTIKLTKREINLLRMSIGAMLNDLVDFSSDYRALCDYNDLEDLDARLKDA